MRVFSFGGGVQSVAVLVLAAQGKVQYDQFLFANVGADSENPETLAYFEVFAVPFAFRHGIPLEELHKVRRNGDRETLLGRIRRSERSIPIPMHMNNGAPGNRQCTGDFKISVVAKWLREHGATAESPATVGLGISTDEFQRARSASKLNYERLEYPLLDLRLSRLDCRRIIADVGLPIPPKSACFFCPFQSPTQWRRLKHDKPALFAQSVEIEGFLNARGGRLGKDRVWMTRYAAPLDQVISGEQMTFDDYLDTCESGYCFT